MKVLFAVNNESISESITKKYQQEYKEIISAKNVYYFNAIIKELQRDKSYDRIVISEDLQPFSNNNYDQIDKFIFEKMDNISDEATKQNGNDIPIILICADRREKSDPLLVKMFGIGVYNALIGKDRSITAVCQLLNRPRSKKEAKVYYHIDPDDVDYKVENEGDVSEVEIQNILNHYKRLGRNEEQYVESFDHIASQYTDSQLRLIAKFLPLNVKAVLEANSPKYQEVVALGMPSKPDRKYNQYNNYNNYKKDKDKNKDKNQKNVKPVDDTKDLDIIKQNLEKNVITEPVIIPSAINTNSVRKVNSVKPKEEPTISQPIYQDENEEEDLFEDIVTDDGQIEENQKVELEQPKRRGRPKKIKAEQEVKEQEATVVKRGRGRGRPKKQQEETIEQDNENSEEANILPGLEEDVSSPVNLFELGDEEQKDNINKDSDSDMILPGIDNEFLFAQDGDQNERSHIGVSNLNEKNNISSTPRNNDSMDLTQTTTNNYNNTSTASIISKDKKVVTFIGTSKNGTSFLVNNIAEIISQKGINTAILDLTQNKNAYYIYTENDENLRNIAYSSIENLKIGNAKGIQVHKNLAVYTSLPGKKQDTSNYINILETLTKNYSLVIIDCDYDTDYNYFAQAQEIYLVQSLDILTIQPLTAFLRNLKAKNALNPEKIRVVLNKMVNLKSVTEKTIIGGMAYYNDPSMSFMTELFNKDTVKYCVIPFEEQTYAKYLDGIINCKISLNGYSRNCMTALNTLSDMVYPLVENNTTRNNKTYNSYSSGNNFSASMNSTLNKMKNNY